MAYDAFLSHNSSDRDAVEYLAARLQEDGLSVFLDRWHLKPGDPWQEGLELALEFSRACVVFVGTSGFGPWEVEEMRVAVDRRTRNPSFRVIPVLLPGVDATMVGQLPSFLRRFQSVAFQGGLGDATAMGQLVTALRTPSVVQDSRMEKPRRSLVCLSGPSAVGKDVLLHRLLHRLRAAGVTAGYLRKYTTRQRRLGEDELKPFAYVAPETLHALFHSGAVGCPRYSYGNWYGIDASFEEGLTLEQVLFVSQRLYKEISDLRSLADRRGLDLYAILLKSDRRSLISRSLHRSLSVEQRNHRMAQVLDDLDFLDADPGVADLFDLVVDNGDALPLRVTEEAIWTALQPWLVERHVASQSLQRDESPRLTRHAAGSAHGHDRAAADA